MGFNLGFKGLMPHKMCPFFSSWSWTPKEYVKPSVFFYRKLYLQLVLALGLPAGGQVKLLMSCAFLLFHACVGHLPLCWLCTYKVLCS